MRVFVFSGLEIKKECCSLYVSPWSKYFVTQIQMLCATYRAQKLLVCYGKWATSNLCISVFGSKKKYVMFDCKDVVDLT